MHVARMDVKVCSCPSATWRAILRQIVASSRSRFAPLPHVCSHNDVRNGYL
jgi:hypothetical protein